MSQSNQTPEERQKQTQKHIQKVNLIAVAGGALASISAAVVASYLGVAGTLIGAAVASVVSSVAGAIYTGLLAITRERVRHRLRRPALDQETQLRELRELRVGPRRSRPRRPATRWLLVGAATLLLFTIAVGAVTGIEAAIRRPLASAFTGRHEGDARTSVGAALEGSSEQRQSDQQGTSSSTTQSGGSVPRASGEPAPPSSSGTTITTSPPTSTPPTSTPSTAPPSTR